MSTASEFERMQAKATTNKAKGKKGGDCNRTQCQSPGASCWNRGSLSWYCKACGVMLNEYSPGVMEDGDPMVIVLPNYFYASGESPVFEGRRKAIIDKGTRMHEHFEALGTCWPYVRIVPKVGRNEPCPCMSGKKFKQCCIGETNE